jgi:hypothetical protein
LTIGRWLWSFAREQTDTRIELDAFVACRVAGVIEVERVGTGHLAKSKDKPVNPFDP